MLRATLVALLVVALAGCVLPPKSPPALTAVDGAGLGLDGPSAAGTPEGWWRSFGDPQLDRLIEQALAGSPTLGLALARMRAAQATLGVAEAADRPGVTLNGQERRARLPERDIYPPPYGGATVWQGGVSADLSWSLDLFGRHAALIRQARAAGVAAELDAASARLAVAGSFARAYLALDHAWNVADLAQRSEAQRSEIVRLTARRVDAGLAARSELRQAQAAVPQARVARLQAEAERELAVHELAALAGLGAASYPRFARPQLDLTRALPLPQRLPADLLGRRPDVLAARARIEAATGGRDAARAAFYPDVNLAAFVGVSAIGLGNLFRSDARTYGAGPAIHLPLFDSRRLKSQYRGATAELDAAVATYNAAVLEAVRQCADQLTLIGTVQAQLEAQQAELEAAEDAWQLTRQRYAAGLSGQLPVLAAESAVLSARRSRIDLVERLATARVSLLLALGGSFQPASQTAAAGG